MLQIQISLTGVFLTGTIVVVALVVFILLYIIIYQQKVSRFTKTLQQQELQKQKEVFSALTQGEEKERKRIAEELHDGIGAKLSGIKMNIEYLQQGLHHEFAGHFNQVLRALNESIDELREISHNLQPSVIGAKGLQHALNDFISSLRKRNTMEYRLFWNADQLSFSGDHDELSVYRMISELLHNIHKHACATETTIQVNAHEAMLQIIVEDNGKGFDPDQHYEGIGLVNLRSRTAHLGGKLMIDSSSLTGTTVIIELPLKTGS